MPLGYSNEDRMSAWDDKPIIDNNDKPMMEEQVEADVGLHEVKGERMAAMEQLIADKPMPAQKGKGNLMEPFKTPEESESERHERPEPKDAFPVQDDLVTTSPDDVAEEGYVRLRLRVENGEMQIIGARAVEGPLLLEDAIHGDLAYEVRLGQQRITLGTIPDVGEIRSFPPPQPTEEIHGHHIIETSGYEFTVRIPRRYFTRKTVNDIEIIVFRTKGEMDVRQFSPDVAAIRQEVRLRTVAELSGLMPQALNDNVRRQVETILGGKAAQ